MNKQTNKLIPERRFPEFLDEGEWVVEELGNCLNYLQPTNYLVSSTAYQNKFKIPVLTAGKTFILGYTDEEYGIFSEKLPVIIFDDFTTASKYVDFAFKAKSSAMKILLSKNNNDIKFVFELMQTIGYEVGVHERHWISTFTKLKITIPSLSEQQRIASCLSSLDEVITAHTNKLETLKTYKKGLMQNLFPQEGEKVPKLRFKEFEKDGVWIEKSLDYLTTKISDGIHTTPNYDDAEDYYFINGNNLIDGKIWIDIKTKRVSKEEYNRHKRDLNDSTILLSINGTIGNIAEYNNEKVVLGKSACYINVDKIKVVKTFIIYFIQTNSIKSYYDSELTGSTIKNLSLKSIKETVIKVPNKHKEQQKIADTLSSLDELIKEQADKIEQLKLHKKGLMQGLFPKVKN